MHANQERDAVRLLFIGGLGRSGSTLLERLLGELPGVCGLGEVVHLWQRGLVDGEKCACGAGFHECPFWGEVGKRAFDGWSRLDPVATLALKASVDRTRNVPSLGRSRLRPPLEHQVADYVELYRRLYTAVTEVSGDRLLVDSSKHVSLAYCLRWSAEIDLRVLHVVRDPRAVAHSWSKVVARPEAVPGSAETEYMARWSPARTALHWNAQNLGYDRLSRLDVPVLRVRYEDFVTDTAATLTRVAEFAGLGRQTRPPVTVDGAFRLGPNHQVAGNPMRFRTGEVSVRADDAWRTAMPAPRRRLVTAMTLPLLRTYGYPVRTEA